MNKYLFWILTIILTLILIFMIGYTGTLAYIQSDEYVEPGETIEEIPLEMQIAWASSVLVGLISMVLCTFFAIMIGWVIKGKRIELNVLMYDNSERKINAVRISFYVITIMAAFTASQAYPVTLWAGWVMVLLWIAAMLTLAIWTLNIIYAFAQRRALKGKKIKRSKI